MINATANFKIDTDKWGWLEAASLKIDGLMIVVADVTRNGEPFLTHGLIPVHQVKMIVPPAV